MKDILLNEDGSLMIKDGDFVAGENIIQQQAMLLATHQGEFKHSPEVGVGISDLLLGEELLEYRHKIRNQFAMDGLKINKLELYDIGNLKIDAEYADNSS
ncbi:oxidase [Epilithonimonas vandammei]|uniref:Oxidase n=1 Tax=Epilithonimonas vandammei TaxID=2487072 RepID=A0A3G8Z975_9FLAO|nr:oxidase [Epilithonimonas vandammei]AZI53909.1 oxidase [Epilithonimonas vandammei]AZI55671.1 oxidase [Epilithonimonas vandammei]